MDDPTNTILCPIDFGDASMKALSLAKDLAGRLEADVVLLHVYVEPVVAYPGMTPILVPGLGDEVATAARRAVDDLAAQSPGVRAMVRTGDPAAEILAVVEALRPRMVVMGTHGREGLQRLFLGSVAEQVVRASASPVLTVRLPGDHGP